MLGASGRAEAPPLLLELDSPLLLNEFTRFYQAPATPAVEQLVLANRRRPNTGRMLLRLLHQYRSLDLFNALIADARESPLNSGATVKALLEVNAPGTETQLLELLPLLQGEESRLVARYLAERQFLPAEGVFIDMLKRAKFARGYDGLGNTARSVLPLGTQAVMDAALEALAKGRGLPPSPTASPPMGRLDQSGLEHYRLIEQNADLASLVAELAIAPPRVRVDGTIFPATWVNEFSPEHQPRITEMLKRRQEVEERFREVTPANFIHWAVHGGQRS